MRSLLDFSFLFWSFCRHGKRQVAFLPLTFNMKGWVSELQIPYRIGGAVRYTTRRRYVCCVIGRAGHITPPLAFFFFFSNFNPFLFAFFFTGIL